MAKFKVEFEKGIPKYTLVFRGVDFSYSMIPCRFGSESDSPDFSIQLAQAFSDLDISVLENRIDINMLDCYLDDEEEIFKILKKLEALE